MSESKRIVFTFDSKTLEALDTVVKLGEFATLADAVRTSITNMATMETAKADGNSKIEVLKKSAGGEVMQLQVKL